MRYHRRPVSIFGGMIELPLVVERQDGATWFADAAELTSGRRWVVRDSELRGETERLSAELITLPMFPTMSDAQRTHVLETLRETVEALG